LTILSVRSITGDKNEKGLASNNVRILTVQAVRLMWRRIL